MSDQLEEKGMTGEVNKSTSNKKCWMHKWLYGPSLEELSSGAPRPVGSVVRECAKCLAVEHRTGSYGTVRGPAEVWK